MSFSPQTSRRPARSNLGRHGIWTLPQIEEELVQIGTNAGTLLRELQGKHKGALIGLSHATTSDRTASNTT